jgi:hypothetical protein
MDRDDDGKSPWDGKPLSRSFGKMALPYGCKGTDRNKNKAGMPGDYAPLLPDGPDFTAPGFDDMQYVITAVHDDWELIVPIK